MADRREAPFRARETSNILDPAVRGFDVSRSRAHMVLSTTTERRVRGASAPPDISTRTIFEFVDEVPELPHRTGGRSFTVEHSRDEGSRVMSWDMGRRPSQVAASADTLDPAPFRIDDTGRRHSEVLAQNEGTIGAAVAAVTSLHDSQPSTPLTGRIQAYERSVEERIDGAGPQLLDIIFSEDWIRQREDVVARVQNMSDSEYLDAVMSFLLQGSQTATDAQSPTARETGDHTDRGSLENPVRLLAQELYLLNTRRESELIPRRREVLLFAVMLISDIFGYDRPLDRIIQARAISDWESIIRDMETESLEDALRPTAAGLEVLPPRPPSAPGFLVSLDVVRSGDFPEDDRSCPVCQEPYVEDLSTGLQREEVVVLPNCRHTFGSDCLIKWLDPNNELPSNTCPLCRTVLFPLPQPLDQVLDFPEQDIIIEVETPGQLLTNEDHTFEEVPEIEEITGTPRERDTAAFLQAIAEASAHTGDPDYLLNSSSNPFTPTTRCGLFSNHLLHLFRVYYRGLHEDVIAGALAGQMGLLIGKLEETMERMMCPRPWGVEGPRLADLIDPEMRGMIEVTLERLREVEEVYLWHLRADEVFEGSHGRELEDDWDD